jgi:hypothetical protein
MSLIKRKCLYSNNCLQFLKCAVPLYLFYFNALKVVICSIKYRLFHSIDQHIDLFSQISFLVPEVAAELEPLTLG